MKLKWQWCGVLLGVATMLLTGALPVCAEDLPATGTDTLPAATTESIPPSSGPAQTLFLGLGAEYASGDYGSPVTTRSLYMPLTLTWVPNDRIDLGVEIPYLYQNNSAVTTVIYRSGGMMASAVSMGPGPGSGMGGPGGTSTVSESTTSTSSSVAGLGDIILRFGVIGWHESPRIPQVRVSTFVKLPTASTSDGLGTGEVDAGGGIDLSKWYGDLHLLGEGLFTYQGRVPGYRLQNYLSFTAGAGYQVTATLQPMLLLKGSTAPSDYADDLLEARARMIWSLSQNTALDLYLSRGLTESSPDYGGGLAIIYAF